jgi:hypothetical protein
VAKASERHGICHVASGDNESGLGLVAHTAIGESTMNHGLMRCVDKLRMHAAPAAMLAAITVSATACGSSDSQVVDAGASSGTAGSGGLGGSTGSGTSGSTATTGSGSGASTGSATSGSNASSGVAGTGAASSGAAGSGASSGLAASGTSSGSASNDGGSCSPPTSLTLATNITLAVTWAASTAGNAGSGNVHIWLLAKYAVNGNKLTGTSQTCGLALPDLQLSGLGQIAAGGMKVQIEVPPSVWATSSMPTFPSTATTAGWDPSGAFSVDASVSLIGLALPAATDPATYMWSSSSWTFPQGTTFPDHDGDKNPGITATPRNGNGYVFPPTAVGLGGSAPVADQVYIVSRNKIAQSGKWTSCQDVSGTATVTLFDNHVVGCRVHGGSTCTTNAANTQADFLDQNRTVYVPGTASFVAKALASTATCADALTALP